MHLIFERLKGATFQAELLVMTVLGLVNCALNWMSPFNWSSQAERINNVPMNSKYSGEIKTVLRWVVIARMIIDHMYIVSYLGNLYSVFTWCRPNLLLPWMTVSAFKNFLLQLIAFVVTLQLYLEGNFSTSLFVEFIVESIINFVIAAYYWRGIKKAFVELTQIQRRKLTRAGLTQQSNTNAQLGNDFNDKKRRFMSFTNFGELSFHSAFELDGDLQQNRLTKSLTTLLSMDSHSSVEPEEGSTLPILDDSVLSPVEKSMRILGVNLDDVNQVRFRLGKSVLNDTDIRTTYLPIRIQKVTVSTGKINDFEAQKNPKLRKQSGKVQNVLDVRKENLINNKNLQDVIETSGTARKRCVCPKSNDVSADADVLQKNSLTNLPKEDKSGEYESDDNDLKGSRNSLKPAVIPVDALRKSHGEVKSFGASVFWSLDFPVSKKSQNLSGTEHSNSPLETLENHSPDHFKSNLISIEQPKLSENDIDSLKNEITQSTVDDTSSIRSKQVEFTGFENFLKLDTHPGFYDRAEEWKAQDSSVVEAHSSTLRPSTLTRINVSDFWKDPLIKPEKTYSRVVMDQFSSTLDLPKPRDFPKHPRRSLLPGIALLAKLKRPEQVQEREARELRALRAYNRLTLLEDKREMETKKGNSGLMQRRPRLLSPLREIPKADTKQRVPKEMNQTKLDKAPKRQVRTQEKPSNLGNFNLGLDALENSISLSFSGEKKNRLQNSPNKIPPNSQLDGRKQLSKYSKPMRVFDATDVSSSARIEGVRTGRDLQRIPGLENITCRDSIWEADNEDFDRHRMQEELLELSSSSLERLQDRQPKYLRSDMLARVEDKHGIASLMAAFKNIDWGFKGYDAPQREDESTSQENVLYDIIDDDDTITLLQSAFASNTENTTRGFFVTPGSTEIYSMSDYLEDVLEEIMKTTRLRPNTDAFTVEVTTGVDYGDSYLQELEVTTFSMTESSDEETLMEADSVAEQYHDEQIKESDTGTDRTLKSAEMCWSSYSGEGIVNRLPVDVPHFVSQSTGNDQFDLQTSPNEPRFKFPNARNIVELLDEKEISHVEYWAKELKDLALNGRDKDFELVEEFRHLTELPGFCVVKTLVDFFRHFIAVSRSTMTSRIFPDTSVASTPSSVGSEEVVSGYFNELSNTSAAIESTLNLESNLDSVGIVERNVFDSLHSLIEQATESTDTRRGNDQVLGAQEGQTTFPLREGQFYFGTPESTRHLISHIAKHTDQMTSNLYKKLALSDGINSEITEERIDASPNAPVNFYIFGATSITRDLPPDSVMTKNPGIPFKTDSAVDSFESLYSIGTAGVSNTSHNITSIGGASSFEEFLEEPSNLTPATIESRNPDVPSRSERGRTN